MHVSDNTSVLVLVNSTTGLYTHTLKFNGTELSAVYGCSVSNNKPSLAKVMIMINENGNTKFGVHNCCQHRVNVSCFTISLKVTQVQNKSLYPVVNPAL